MVKPSKKLKKTLLIVGITGAVYASFRYLLPLVVPFLVAYILALALKPGAAWLEKKSQFTIKGRHYGLPIGIIGGIELLLLLSLLGIGLYFGGRKLCEEAKMLSDAFPVWINRLDIWLTGACHRTEGLLNLKEGCLVLVLRDMIRDLGKAAKGAAMPFLMVNSMTLVSWAVKITVVTVILFVGTMLSLQEMDELRKRKRNSMFYREFALLSKRLVMVGNAYLKTQLLIMLLTTLVCTAGLFLIGNPYYIMAGIGIGLLDALPIFGTGTALIPWTVFMFVNEEWVKGFVLLGIYIVCYFLREIMEAKLMGDKVGLSPLETLVAMYVGLQLFGLLGFILGPIGLLIIEDLVEEYER